MYPLADPPCARSDARLAPRRTRGRAVRALAPAAPLRLHYTYYYTILYYIKLNTLYYAPGAAQSARGCDGSRTFASFRSSRASELWLATTASASIRISIYMYIYIYTHTYTYIYIYIYMYIYI